MTPNVRPTAAGAQDPTSASRVKTTYSRNPASRTVQYCRGEHESISFVAGRSGPITGFRLLRPKTLTNTRTLVDAKDSIADDTAETRGFT